MTLVALQEFANVPLASLPGASAKPPTVHVMSHTDVTEVLEFLAARQTQSVFLAGLICDNGLVSPFNRGTFYGCRDQHGALEGVALIGHATVFEARTDAALDIFAQLALKNSGTNVIFGEEGKIAKFWRHFEVTGQTPRLVCRDLLMELRRPIEKCESLPGLRPATFDDVDLVVAAHAAMAVEEIGVDPLSIDPTGFRVRTKRRIAKGRVWVLIKNDKLMFKADIASDTPEVIYLEGVYVPPVERGKGYGSQCLMSMGHALLNRSDSILLLVHANNEPALAMYQKAGFRLLNYYRSIFLQNPPNEPARQCPCAGDLASHYAYCETVYKVQPSNCRIRNKAS